jgi:hypothetical protein
MGATAGEAVTVFEVPQTREGQRLSDNQRGQWTLL